MPGGGGMGGMGGAQPLAITMNEGTCLAAEMEEWRMQKRIDTRYLDKYSHDIDEAIDRALLAKKECFSSPARAPVTRSRRPAAVARL